MTSPSPSPFAFREPVSAITAYDYPSARLADEAGVQLLLVGDSVGMVVAGQPDTTSVTLEQMVYHTEMVARGVRRAVVVADLPYRSYETVGEALAGGRRLREAGAHAVKLEGGREQAAKVGALVAEEIPVMGHIGMLPQQVKIEGGYKKKGRSEAEADELVASARALQEAGAFALVLESVLSPVAARITRTVGIPTIGIGSGTACSGQIRVFHDVVGAYPWFVPPFAKVYADVAGMTREALDRYVEELR